MSELKGKICAACEDDLPDVVRLAFGLWPDHDLKELEAECADLLKTGTLFALYEAPNGVPVGFAQCQLRHDYVEGTETSPVGYLEGIYVEPAFRGAGHSPRTAAFLRRLGPRKGLPGICERLRTYEHRKSALSPAYGFSGSEPHHLFL